jgi:drug/metabolite transporter (DMT)-like permease
LTVSAPTSSPAPSVAAANTAILLTVVAWGGQIPMMAALMERWDPYWLGSARYICALPILLLVMWRTLERPSETPWGKAAMLGFFGIGGFGLCFSLGIRASGPVMSAVIMAFGPSIAALVARFFFKAPLPNGMWLALLLGCGGASLAMVDPGQMDRLELKGGEGLLIIASMIWYWYSLQAPRWLPGMSNMAMSSVTMTAGAIAMILIYPALWAMGVAGDPTLPINAEEWGMLIWVVALGSIGGTFFWNYGVRGIGVVLASLYSNLCPLVAVGIAAALGTPPSVWQLIGGGLVIAGVVQLQLRQAKRP